MNTKNVTDKAERKKVKRVARKKAAPKATRAAGPAEALTRLGTDMNFRQNTPEIHVSPQFGVNVSRSLLPLGMGK